MFNFYPRLPHLLFIFKIWLLSNMTNIVTYIEMHGISNSKKWHFTRKMKMQICPQTWQQILKHLSCTQDSVCSLTATCLCSNGEMHGYTVETCVRVLSCDVCACDVCACDEKESIHSSPRSIFHRLLYTLYTSCIPRVYLVYILCIHPLNGHLPRVTMSLLMVAAINIILKNTPKCGHLTIL